MPKRKRFTAGQKAAMILEALKEEKTIAQIAAENGVHPNQIHKWKRQAPENLPQLFAEHRQGEKALKAEHERQVSELYAEIGRLCAQLSWLKKKSGFHAELGRAFRHAGEGQSGDSVEGPSVSLGAQLLEPVLSARAAFAAGTGH